MLKNYIKIAWRNILKNKLYAAVNIIGLTVGLTIGLLILLWVNDELGFDHFNTKADRIYHISASIGSGGSKQIWSDIAAPIGYYALKEVPGVQYAVRMQKNYDYSIFRYKDKQLDAGGHGAYFTDPSIFKVFDFKLLKGNVDSPFPDDHSIIITETTAKKYFGNAEPIGKVLLADNKDNYVVSGVMADFPENSSIKADMLFSIDLVKKSYNGKGYWKTMDGDFGNFMFDTYLLLRPGISAQSVADKLTQINIRHHTGADAVTVKFIPQPLLKMHLYLADGTETGFQTVRVFLIVAIIILLIACINYVNLSTARAMLRSKEVSLRKIIGAGRKQLFAQFVIETVFFFSIALVFAFILIILLMPLYNQLSGKQMHFNLLDASIWKVISITVTILLIASSIYPALLLSSFKPIGTLKGRILPGISNTAFRRVLVVCQFTFSIALIIGTLVINQQLKYMKEKELGYDKSYVFGFTMRSMQDHYESIRAGLMNQPGIINVTRSGDNIVTVNNTTSDLDWDGKDVKKAFLIHPINIDKNYISFFKLKLIDGSGFIGESTDTTHYILNETAIKQIGIRNPIGKRFKLHDWNGTIIGIIKDFHFTSLKQTIEPAVFYYRPQYCGQIFIRTTGRDAPKAIKAAETCWKKYNAAFPFNYSFLDTTYDNLYKSDERSGILFSLFTIIAIIISCLGLFGLATYSAQVRVKEIGIRKALGATAINITAMFSKDFLVLVFISILIASPIAWYGMNKWLQDYAYRIHIQWWFFALGGITALLIALITISFQAIKAALANPVESLRSE